MPTNKHATIRYQTLDKCFRNTARRFYFQDLLDACNEALRSYDPDTEGIQKRQLYEDIKFMLSEIGWSIPLEKVKDGRKVYYRYQDTGFSINNQSITTNEAEKLKSALLVLTRFKGLPQFEWIHELIFKLEQQFKLQKVPREIISFDTNEYLKGIENLEPLFNAILYKQVLEISYQSFSSENIQRIEIHPQYLKQFNNRWFLLGKNEEYTTLTNFALDRIKNIKKTQKIYETIDIDFDAYFEDIIGVTKLQDSIPQVITLRAAKKLAPYILTKPIHGSQKYIKNDDTGLVFTIEVIPNYELERQLLSFGEDIVVCSPESLRNKIRKRLKKQLQNY